MSDNPKPSDKKPRLFYWEDAVDGWAPADGLTIDDLVSLDLLLGDGGTMEIRFIRIDMTDEEYERMPEG